MAWSRRRRAAGGWLTLAVLAVACGCTVADPSASLPSGDGPPGGLATTGPSLTGTEAPGPSPATRAPETATAPSSPLPDAPPAAAPSPSAVDRAEMARLLREEAGPRDDADPVEVTRKTVAPLVEQITTGRGDVTAELEELLAALPGGADLEVAWDHPDIGGHLGGVWLRSPDVVMLNSDRLSRERSRAASTVLHEIVHTYQGRILDRLAEEVRWSDGLTALERRLDKVFDGDGLERSADCVALALGATWTHYADARDCDSYAQREAVTALLQSRMP